jgi:alanine dehydrogenase
VLVLTRSQTEGIVTLAETIEAVEAAFALAGRGEALDARRFHVPGTGGGAFHVVTGGLAPQDGGAMFAIKCNSRFPQPEGANRLAGAILLADADSGVPVAVLDARVVTRLRTAAVTAVAARHLARADARSALIVGSGRQAAGQIEALMTVRALERVAIASRNPAHAQALAELVRGRGVPAEAVPDPRAAAAESDIIVTVTTAGEPLLFDADVPPGCFVAALGADGPGKQELDTDLLGRSRVVVDVLAQCVAGGELRSALAAGAMTEADVAAELGEVVAGIKPGRQRDDERFVFDSTGTALQDVAAAALVVERARALGRGLEVDLAG